jgi:hypothetical protein
LRIVIDAQFSQLARGKISSPPRPTGTMCSTERGEAPIEFRLPQ